MDIISFAFSMYQRVTPSRYTKDLQNSNIISAHDQYQVYLYVLEPDRLFALAPLAVACALFILPVKVKLATTMSCIKFGYSPSTFIPDGYGVHIIFIKPQTGDEHETDCLFMLCHNRRVDERDRTSGFS